MSDAADHEDRIMELETRLAFQDDGIQSLSEQVHALYEQLEAQQRQMARLKQRLNELERSGDDGGDGRHEPPPHY